MDEPFFFFAADEPAAPLLYDSPHSGRDYPDDFAAGLARVILRRAEDAYVDELIGEAPKAGVALFAARFPRAYLDVNRDADDIDQALLDAPWPEPLKPSAKSDMGVGLIRRFVTPGAPIYDRKLTVAEVKRRLDAIYKPYHAALAEGIDATRARHGFVWHVDWHSMKSVGNAMTPDGPGARRPDFVVGDRDGTSAERFFSSAVIALLKQRGYSVAYNDPYKGVTIVQRYGDPARGAHVLQIEINRALYLDEANVEKSAGFAKLRADLTGFTRDLADAARACAQR